MRKARLIASVPMERVDQTGGDGSTPELGDVVVLDQGFTFPDGRSGGSVFCLAADGRLKWCADILDSEIEGISENENGT